MVLYDNAVSGNCYKVRLLLAHLGHRVRAAEVDVVDRSDRPRAARRPQPGAARADARARRRAPLAESGAILWYFAEGTRFVPDDRYERAQVLQWMFFEQYNHEPAIAVVRFWLAYSGRSPAESPTGCAEQHAAGYRALDAMERHLDGREYFVGERYARRHRALRVHARRARGRLRPRPATRRSARGSSGSRPSRAHLAMDD